MTEFVFIILLLLVISQLQRNISELFFPQVKFLTDLETKTIILNDEDGYINGLTNDDLVKRGVTSIEEYIQKISSSPMNFTNEEKDIIEDSVTKAQIFFEELKDHFIDSKLISNMNWNFGLTIDEEYEMGLPHTRYDVIFLTPSHIKRKDIVKLLIHEKIHVYQRKYKKMFQEKLLENGYEIIGERKKRKDLRSNPDLDEYVYKKGDKIYDKLGIYEHPNEEISYAIEKKIIV